MKKRFETIAESLSYRQPMQVKEVLICKEHIAHSDVYYTYPICPRCNVSFEQDYQSYCSYCGQKLKWRYYSKAKIRCVGEK